MNHLEFFGGVWDLANHFGVPSLVEEENSVATENVEIVLVLSHHEIVNLQKINEFFEDAVLSKCITINKKKPRVEEFVAVDAEVFLNVSSVLVDLYHRLLVSGTHDVVVKVRKIKLGDVARHDRVAVDINRLVYRGEHIRNKEAVICCL